MCADSIGEMDSMTPTDPAGPLGSTCPEVNTSGPVVRNTGAGSAADAGEYCGTGCALCSVSRCASCSMSCDVGTDPVEATPFEAEADETGSGAVRRGSLTPIEAASRASTGGRNISSVTASSGFAREGGADATATVGVMAAGTGSSGIGGGSGAACFGVASSGATSACATSCRAGSTGAASIGATSIDACGCSVCPIRADSRTSGPSANEKAGGVCASRICSASASSGSRAGSGGGAAGLRGSWTCRSGNSGTAATGVLIARGGIAKRRVARRSAGSSAGPAAMKSGCSVEGSRCSADSAAEGAKCPATSNSGCAAAGVECTLTATAVGASGADLGDASATDCDCPSPPE